MTQYIDKSTLVAEIERLISNGRVKLQEFQESNDYESNVVWSEHIATCRKILNILDTLEVKEVEDKFEIPQNGIKDAIEVVSRMKHIDDDLKPIADFILGYASWNLHKDEWNQPTIEVPLFRVLDALIHRGKGYYCR